MLDSDVVSAIYIMIFVVSFIVGKMYMGKVKRKILRIFFRAEEDEDDEQPRFRIKTA